MPDPSCSQACGTDEWCIRPRSVIMGPVFWFSHYTHTHTETQGKKQNKTKNPRLTLLFPRNLAMVTLPKWHLGPQQWSVGTSRSHLKIHPVEKRENVCIIWSGCHKRASCGRWGTEKLSAKLMFQRNFPQKQRYMVLESPHLLILKCG